MDDNARGWPVGDSSRWPGVLENKNRAQDLVLRKGRSKGEKEPFRRVGFYYGAENGDVWGRLCQKYNGWWSALIY